MHVAARAVLGRWAQVPGNQRWQKLWLHWRAFHRRCRPVFPQLQGVSCWLAMLCCPHCGRGSAYSTRFSVREHHATLANPLLPAGCLGSAARRATTSTASNWTRHMPAVAEHVCSLGFTQNVWSRFALCHPLNRCQQHGTLFLLCCTCQFRSRMCSSFPLCEMALLTTAKWLVGLGMYAHSL